MKNDQIVKLINKYEKKNEKISPDLMNNLLSANSELIDYILNSDISTDMLEKCFKYSLFSTLDLKTQILILENDNGEFGRFNDFLKIKPKFISKILKIIYNSKNSEALIYGERYLKSCKPFGSNELLIFKAILNSKNEDNASNSYAIATNYSPYVNCEKKLELTKIVADAKNPDEASEVATNIDVIESGHVLELTNLIANVSKSVATELCKMINSGYIDIVIALIDVFEKRINVNNFDAVISLITSGDYERSKNPIESLGKILRTTNNYQPFTVVYKDSAQEAVKGSRALDKAFPGIDIKGNTYIKTRKNKKGSQQDNNR